jgi:hypothetical protein
LGSVRVTLEVPPRYGIGLHLPFTKEAFVLSIVNVRWCYFAPETI